MNYLFFFICLEENEVYICFLFMYMVSIEGIGLKELYSEDVDFN